MASKFHKSDTKPVFTPYGYLVTEDGIIHSLLHQSCHGVVLAILFPALAAKYDYDPPGRDPDVLHYQQFELDHSHETSVIRVSSSMLSGQLNISKSKTKATEAQIQAMSYIFTENGLKLNDLVQTELKETTVRKFLTKLRSGEI